MAQRRLLQAKQFQHVTALGDALLEAAVTYDELARAQAIIVAATDQIPCETTLLMNHPDS